jgi:hypothetical protein
MTKAIERTNKFKPGNKLVKIITVPSSPPQIVEVDYVDYSREVYVFTDLVNHHWTQWRSMSFEMTERIFRIHE